MSDQYGDYFREEMAKTAQLLTVDPVVEDLEVVIHV